MGELTMEANAQADAPSSLDGNLSSRASGMPNEMREISTRRLHTTQHNTPGVPGEGIPQ